MIPAAYRPLLAMREARLPLVGSTIGRLPLGASGLAVILMIKATTGSFAQAGVVEAAVTIGAGVGLPVQGRIIDRTGQTAVLAVAQAVSAVSATGLVLSAHSGAGLAVLVAFAFAFGASFRRFRCACGRSGGRCSKTGPGASPPTRSTR